VRIRKKKTQGRGYESESDHKKTAAEKED